MNITSQKEITDMVDIIKTQTILFNESKNKPYQISFSIGCCKYESKLESTDDFFKKLDASMYEDKKRKTNDKIISC
jgi:GGDEF domain-containing protein